MKQQRRPFNSSSEQTLTPAPVLQQKALIKLKQDSSVRTFYYKPKDYQQEKQSQKEQSKKFLIKTKKNVQTQAEIQNELDWSSSEDEMKRPIPKSESELQLESKQRELRINFLKSLINYTFEPRVVIQEEKPESYDKLYLLFFIFYFRGQFRKQQVLFHEDTLRRLRAVKFRMGEAAIELILALRVAKKWKRFVRKEIIGRINQNKRYPQKEGRALIIIQKYFKLWYIRKTLIKQTRKTPIIRKRLLNHKFEGLPNTIQNQLFVFLVKFDKNIFEFSFSPYFRRKCDKRINKTFKLDIEKDKLFYILSRIYEYIDCVEAEIEPNLVILQTFQQMYKECQKIFSIEGKQYKLNKSLNYVIKKIQEYPFENLIFFDDFNNLQLYGITDFIYSDTFIQDKTTQVHMAESMINIKKNLGLITKIQNIIKAQRAIDIFHCKINKKRDISSSFYVRNNDKIYAQVFITKAQTLFARWTQDRKWLKTNFMEISPLITKQLGFPCRENFFEIYQIVDGKLVYTEEGQYWKQKEIAMGKKEQKQSFYQVVSMVNKIQRAIKRYLFQKERIIRQQTLLHQQTLNKSLVRRVVIQEEPVRAYYMNFQLFEKQGSQNIQIDVKTLEHTYSNEYVHPYTQPLFYDINQGELTKIGQKMIEIGQVKLVKGQLKFEVCNLMEVQGMLMNEDNDDDPDKRKENTLQARRILNNYIRNKLNKRQYFDFQNNQVKNSNQSQKKKEISYNQNHMNPVEMISSLEILQCYKNYSQKKAQLIYDNKDCIARNQESVKNFVRIFKPQSQYCYGENVKEGQDNINFLQLLKEENEQKEKREQEDKERAILEEQQRKQDELERLRKLKEALCYIYHDYFVVDGERLLIEVIYNKVIKQLLIKSKDENNITSELNVDIMSILAVELSVDFLRNSIDNLVLKQLKYKQEELMFKLDPRQQEFLQIQYVKWQQDQNKPIDYSNLVGNVYGLEILFKTMNKSQKTIYNLKECGKQVFLINNYQIDNHLHEYVFNISDDQLILTIYFENNTENFKIHIIPVQEFKCIYLMRIVKYEPPQSIIKILTPFIEVLNKILIIDDCNSNFQSLRSNLSKFFYEIYAMKIQKRLRVKQSQNYYSLLRRRNKGDIYIQSNIINADNRYIRVSFFLQQYELKMVFTLLNDIDTFGQIIDNQHKLIYYINLLKTKVDDQQFRISPDRWVEIEQIRLPNYYQTIYKQLLQYIIQNIRIDTPFKIIFSNDLKAYKKQEIQIVQKTESAFYRLINAVIKLQVQYKTYKQKEKFELAKLNMRQQYSKARQIGKLVYRTYRQIAGNQYIVIVSKLSGIQDQITVDLIDFLDRKNKNKSYRGIQMVDPTSMINLGSKIFYEYLLDSVEIDEGLLKFKENAFQPLTWQDEQSPLKLQVEEQQKVRLIHHIQKHQDKRQPETIYNVIHSGQGQANLPQEDNTVQVTVNLTDLMKLYPSLHTQDQQVMKMVSDQMIDSIIVDNQGNIQVDQSKINPSFIKIKKPNQIQVKSVMKRDNAQINTLSKKTAYFGKDKFLLVVNELERKVNKIIQEDVDSVFSHYEQLYQVVATSLNTIGNNNSEPLEWEMSYLEAQQLTHQKDSNLIATELSKRTMVVNQKFLYLAIEKDDISRMHFENVILFLEKGIRPIQNRFKYRKQLINFKNYRMTLKQFKDTQGQLLPNVYMSLEALKSEYQFIVLIGEDKAKHLMVIAWNIHNFSRYDQELQKSKFQQLFQISKLQTYKILINFIQFKNQALEINLPSQQHLLKMLNDSKLNLQLQIS